MSDPKFKNVPNKKIKSEENGTEHYLNRASSVIALPFFEVEGANLGSDPLPHQTPLFLPVTKRSADMELYPNYWSLACGYLEWNEDIQSALIREVWEEVGLYLPDFFDVPSQPTWVESAPNAAEDDTIGFRYCLYTVVKDLPRLKPNSPDSVTTQFLPVEQLLDSFKLAFNHNDLVGWGLSMIQKQRMPNLRRDSSSRLIATKKLFEGEWE